MLRNAYAGKYPREIWAHYAAGAGDCCPKCMTLPPSANRNIPRDKRDLSAQRRKRSFLDICTVTGVVSSRRNHALPSIILCNTRARIFALSPDFRIFRLFRFYRVKQSCVFSLFYHRHKSRSILYILTWNLPIILCFNNFLNPYFLLLVVGVGF